MRTFRESIRVCEVEFFLTLCNDVLDIDIAWGEQCCVYDGRSKLKKPAGEYRCAGEERREQ